MTDQTLYDDQGRSTIFTGELLLSVNTDDPVKPKWTVIEVWRTGAGNWVVKRATHSRVVHASEYCEATRNSDVEEVHPNGHHLFCTRCGSHPGAAGWVASDRITVDAYMSTHEMIQSFKRDGHFTQLARTLLADLARLDDRVWDEWMETVVP